MASVVSPPPSSAGYRPRACSGRRCHAARLATYIRREIYAPAHSASRAASHRVKPNLASAMPFVKAFLYLRYRPLPRSPTRDMPAERRRATALDCTHHLQLAEAHMPAVGLTPSRAVIAEDICDLESWSSHGWRARRRRLLMVSPRRPVARRAQMIEWLLFLHHAVATPTIRAVDSSLSCPSNACYHAMSLPRSSRWVAKLWRSECRETVLRSPAAFAASLNSRPN